MSTSINPAPAPTASLLIEGWRGLSHSFSIVNQYQILELLKTPRLTLYHEDVRTDWNRTSNNGEFVPASQQYMIDAVPPACDEMIDCVYRISSPFRAGDDDDRRKTITFMVTESGLADYAFADDLRRRSFFTRERNIIVTPSRWSRDRLAEYGFPHQRICVVPHGVDRSIYYPLSADERSSSRSSLGIREDETVFFNISAPFWNKGVDLLLIAFARLRHAGLQVRLILKDQRGLYGHPIEDAIREVGKVYPPLLQENVISAILSVTTTLSREQLRSYYGIADAYVSPYRAEGFNIPVLEAIACGTPTVVTGGGATDDFCLEGLAQRIPARAHAYTADGSVVRYLEPNLEDLTDAMRRCGPAGSNLASARAQVLHEFDWKQVCKQLSKLILEDL